MEVAPKRLIIDFFFGFDLQQIPQGLGEKWATNTLIKKNKEVRLAKAKKTIITLEEETN